MNWFKILLIASFPLVFLCQNVHAQARTEDEAMSIAADFLQQEKHTSARPSMKMLPRQEVSRQLRRQMMRPSQGYALQSGFYIFNDEEGHGFVIVGADGRQRDILGYATEGTFMTDDLPCGLLTLLEQYNHEYTVAQSQSPQLAAPAHIQTKAVAPLIKTTWDQLTPYNNFCPIDPSTNKRCYTGCVATAMSQVMYYHRFPSSVADSVVKYVSQYDDTRKISLNKRLSTLPLNWSDMLKTYKDVNYTEAQGKAVANLMYAAGLSVQMDYSSEASSAYCKDEAYALINFFGYNPNMKYLCKNYYTEEKWMRLIEEELSEGRPILYGGFGEADNDGKRSGHAFILDGCDSSGRCHFNWGWSGKYQTSGNAYAYYALSSLKPGSSNYTFNQEMVIGIDKNTVGTREYMFYADEFTINGWQQGFRVGDTTTFYCPAFCYDSHANTYHTPLPCYFAYGIVDESAGMNTLSLLTSLTADEFYWCRVFTGKKFYKEVTFDSGHFKEGGTYRIYPVVINADKSRWYGIHTLGAASDYYVARVKNGRVYLGKMQAPSIPDETPAISYVTQTSSNSNLSAMKPGDRIYLKAVFKNTGSSVNTETRVRIFNTQFQGIYYTDGKACIFSSGAQKTVDMSITLPEDIADGTYYTTIQYYRSWGDDPSWIYNKDYVIQFTVKTNSGSSKEMTVKTSSAGYATFYDSQYSYTLPSGLTAYVVTTASSGSLGYKAIASESDVVPKGVPVMLKGGQSKTYKLVGTNSSASYSGANLLRGSDTSTTTTASGSGYLFYKLSYGKSGTAYSSVFGWYWGASGGGAFTIDGHKAWLALKESSTRASFLSLDDLDGIMDVDGDEMNGEDAIYDLSGRQISNHQSSIINPQLRRGIYVKNGKKVFVK